MLAFLGHSLVENKNWWNTFGVTRLGDEYHPSEYSMFKEISKVKKNVSITLQVGRVISQKLHFTM